MTSNINKIWILFCTDYICQSFKTKTNQKMKKVLVAVAVVAFFASCKKDYTCTCSILGTTTTVDYPGLSKSEAETAEAGCTVGGLCTWAEK
jgi:hypothetical protein